MRPARTPFRTRRFRPFALLVAGGLLAPVAASATGIDFETVPGDAPVHGLPIGDQYLTDFGVTFGIDTDGDGAPDALPRLEQVGGDAWSFINDVDSSFDRAWPGYEDQLGEFFLSALMEGAGSALVVSYATPVAAASGEIWDIDGNEQQGTEQWRIQALGAGLSVLETILSPIGAELGPASLNGKPWSFSFTRELDEIFALRIDFVGSKTFGLGLGFDNFSPSEAQPPVPEPGTALLLATGIAGLALRRRR